MNAIFAVGAGGTFAVGNTMPWPKNMTDLQRFKKLTVGGTVVMGRSTWDSDMPKPLPGRRNLVLSSALKDQRCEVYPNVDRLLTALENDKNVWVIGGVKTLWSLRPYINMVYMTQFWSNHKADVVFNTSEFLEDYEILSKEFFEDHSFKIYKRISWNNITT